MKRLLIFLLLSTTLLGCCAEAETLVTNGGVSLETETLPYCTTEEDAPVVYCISEITPDSLIAAYEALDVELSGKVGIKMSTGESTRTNYLRPELIADLIHKLNGTIVECNTAYGGNRSSTAAHRQQAKDNGLLDVAELDILDEEGSMEISITYIDVPVSGGPAGAANGKLSLMIGATEAEFLALGLKPYTDTIGDKYFFMGARGNGNAIKLINNYMAFAAQAINGEALSMADALGISTEAFYEVTTKSSGNYMILGAKRAKIQTGDYKPGFALDLVVKDLELARQLCQDAELANFTLNTALQWYRVAQAKGAGREDSSAVIRVIRETEGKR